MHRLRAWSDNLRANFFFLPAVAVVVAFVFARIAVGIEAGPWVGDATVDSARVVLSTVAAATIAFASISFSVSLLIIQQGSSQFSPRVVHGLTRDPFHRRVIAVVLATFTYCLVVLQRVRGPLEEGGEEVVPRLASSIGLVMGVVAVLAVVAAIHHTSRQMDISQILGGIVEEAVRTELRPASGLHAVEPVEPPQGVPSTVVRFADDGWIRHVDHGALIGVTRPGGLVRLETDTGRYAIRSTPICTLWPAVPPDLLEELTTAVRGAIQIGPTRASRADSGYGVRQLVDVGLRALSPGVNDPTTAQDAIFHLGTVLVARLCGPEVPMALADGSGRRLLTPHATTDADLAELACTELRSAAAGHPMVYLYLFEMLAEVIDATRSSGSGHRVDPFLDEAALLLTAAEAAPMIDHDRRQVRLAHAQRFGVQAATAAPASGRGDNPGPSG